MCKCFAQAIANVGANCIRGRLVPYWFYNTMCTIAIANNAVINHLQHIFAQKHEIKLPLVIVHFCWGTPHIRSIHLNDLSRVAQIIGKCRRRCRSSVHFPAPSLMSATNRQKQKTQQNIKQSCPEKLQFKKNTKHKKTNKQNQQRGKSNKQTKVTNTHTKIKSSCLEKLQFCD